MITALGKKSKNLGALGSSFIDEHYTAAARNQDFMGQPEKSNPDYVQPRKPYKDPLKFKVVESAEMIAKRRQMQWVAKFRNFVETTDRIAQAEIQQPVPRYVAFLAPLKVEKDEWVFDAKAKAAAHAEFLAVERRENIARRLAHALRA